MKYIHATMFMLITIALALPEPPSSSSSSSYSGPASQYGPPQLAPVVHKHVYVHVPPPEPDYQAPRKPIYVPPPQKHYKIVFIKAPSPPQPTLPLIPQIVQNEEKTLVYVLVKKPEDQQDIILPTPVPTQPSKPEVYFIRYKSHKEELAGPYPTSISSPSDFGSQSIASVPSTSYGSPSI